MIQFNHHPGIRGDESPYLKYFGMTHNPFPVAPDNLNFYISEHIDQILSNLVHGITSRMGFIVLTGDVGLGKTTISRRIISILEQMGVETSLVFHTTYQDLELLKEINRDFGLERNSLSYSDQMRLLAQFLLHQNRRRKNCAIIIDDAQNLSTKSLELVRMISNLEADQQKLVQILLIGQPELMEKLNSHQLRQLKSRIMIAEEVKPLTIEELKNYLSFKLNASGNKGLLEIQSHAFKQIYKLTKGNFRQINILLDRCLYVGFFRNTTKISKQVVIEADQDLKPIKCQMTKRWRALIPATVMALLLGVSGFYFSFLQNISSAGFSRLISQVSDIFTTTSPASNSQQPISASIPTSVFADREEELPLIPDAVAVFLKAYSLSTYENAFYDALRYRQFTRVAEDIYSATGYELVRLDRVPGFIRKKHRILKYALGSNSSDSYFLFWRPVLRLKNFYYSYEGHDIFLLQKKLAALQLYDHRLDGIVGPKLLWAVVQFQREMGLQITGFPDVKTTFLICQLAREGHGDRIPIEK